MKINIRIRTLLIVFLLIHVDIQIAQGSDIIPEDVSKIILMSGPNKGELYKVLDFFRHDTLKFKAACFLIKNLDGKYCYFSNNIQDFYNKVSFFIGNTPNLNNKIVQNHYDNLLKTYGNLLDKSIKIYDIDTIKADYLISEINKAFESWNNPWSQDISFSLFCNYILPYRVGEEPLSNWREKYLKLYGNVTENLHGMQNNKYHKFGIYAELCKHVPLSLYIPKSNIVDFPLDMLPDIFMGSCKSIAYFSVTQLRALGIPATVDFIPQWANRSMGHSWGVMFVNDSTSIPFGRGEQLGVHFNARPERKIPKVFRETFVNNQAMSEISTESNEMIPELFKSKNIMDVTNIYTKTSDIEIELFDNSIIISRKWVFLTVFDNEDWVPVCFGKNQKGKASFTKVGRGIVYLPVVYDDYGQYISAGNPFVLSDEGVVIPIIADITQSQSVVLKRKYSYTPRVETAHKQIMGGSLYLSNDKTFKDSLYVGSIQEYGVSAYCPLSVLDDRAFKYVKYYSSPNNMSQTAELLCYDKCGNPISIINTYSLKNDTKGQERAMFDGNVLTSCNMSRITGKWIAAEFDKEYSLSEIRILPSTDGNFIEKGDDYELYFWDDDGWRLIIEKIADDHGKLEIKQVPSGALFLLHDVTKGIEERIFTIEDGNQIWW
ncbi:MAG: hypothetical protein J5957_06080 [Prevotella sp.]|nr:hypothetical protein [Prevotella sp.]